MTGSTGVFDDAEEDKFQFWSPYVSEGILTEGLEEMTQQFESHYDESIELIINGEYTKRVNDMNPVTAPQKRGRVSMNPHSDSSKF